MLSHSKLTRQIFRVYLLQLFHFITGLGFALANQNMSVTTWRTTALALFATVFSCEILRIRAPSGALNAFVIKLFGAFMRSHETRQFAGIAYYSAGVALTSIFYPRDIATLAILTLAVVDPLAAFAGTYFEPMLPGLRLRHGKSITGFIVSALFTAIVIFAVVSNAISSSLTHADAWMLSVLVAFVAASAEFMIPSPRPTFPSVKFPIGLDDNLIIPLLCAFAIDAILRLTYHSFTLSPLLLASIP